MTHVASAPGKLMLMGEHGVLYGRRCLVCAVNRRITVRLTPREDDRVIIQSALGCTETQRQQLSPVEPHRFAIEALRQAEIPAGCSLEIASEFEPTLGLGSSAAVTVATLAAVQAWRQEELELETIQRLGVAVVQVVQGTGSGADIAASTHGGVVLYRRTPAATERIADTLPLVAVYSGEKDPTVRVVKQVRAQAKLYPYLYGEIFNLIDLAVGDATTAIANSDLPALGALLDINHGLMESMRVCNERLASIVHRLRSQPAIHGAKISGSGLGDCAIGLGTVAQYFDLPHLDLACTPQGVTLT